MGLQLLIVQAFHRDWSMLEATITIQCHDGQSESDDCLSTKTRPTGMGVFY
jgi:hypothetical protein